MNTLAEIISGRTATTPRVKRSIADLLAPLDRLAQTILAEYQKLIAYAPDL